jgi:hypothetical protein
VSSYGPNGTHWDEINNTPWYRATNIPTRITVDADWTQIGNAIRSITDTQAANGAAIYVRPGQLPGRGSGAGSPAMLENLGSRTRNRNILIRPLNGLGSVKMTGDVKILRVYGTTWAGMWDTETDICWMGNTNSHIIGSTMKATRWYGVNGQVTENSNAIEIYNGLVNGQVHVSDQDPHGSSSGTSPTNEASGSAWFRYQLIDGCYGTSWYLPAFEEDGYVLGHNDTWQLYGAGVYYGFHFRDNQFWGCHNCAIQLGGAKSSDPAITNSMHDALEGTTGGIPYFAKIEHNFLTNLEYSDKMRYPKPPRGQSVYGGQRPSNGQCINGAGVKGKTDLYGGNYLFGGVHWNNNGKHGFRLVEDSITNRSQDGRLVGTGEGFTVDPSIWNWTQSQLEAVAPTMTISKFRSIWGGA